MTQALNYTPKAISALLSHAGTAATEPDRAGFRYIANLLREAEVFILPDRGELLDRSKPRPEVPGLVLNPPFPVVALEYQSPPNPDPHREDVFATMPCSKRIALAWKWRDDLPTELRQFAPPSLPAGVAVASIAYVDQEQTWIPMAAGFHHPFDGEWIEVSHEGASLRDKLLDKGWISKASANARAYQVQPFGLLPGILLATAATAGTKTALEMLLADVMDEVNAFVDLAYALGCRNVTAERHEAPDRLNRHRIRDGKIPLKDFHILTLAAAGAGEALGDHSHGSPRTHLRRGHIRHLRHLGPDRICWVNATMVRGSGKGFADKQYAFAKAG